MNARKLLAVAVATIVTCLATACGNGNTTSSQTFSTPTVAASSSEPAPFSATVSITDYDPTCRQVKCWLPTQFAPKLVERESVSLYNKWPMDGDGVRVLCATEGEMFLNQAGHPTTTWYGILIPEGMADPKAKARAERVAGGYRAYVGVSWLKSDKHTAPAC